MARLNRLISSVILLLAVFKLSFNHSLFGLVTSTKKTDLLTIDSNTVINDLYKKVKLIQYRKNFISTKYFTYHPKSKVIHVNCTKQIGVTKLFYDIELLDNKGLYKKNPFFFSVGDDYKLITSYFTIDGIKVSLDKVHTINGENEFITRISDIWIGNIAYPNLKHYSIGKREIFLIMGKNPFCNGHNCKDYVVYVLQKQDGKASVAAIYFSGDNYPYDFNNLKLFYDAKHDNPLIFIPKSDEYVKSKLDLDTYQIKFDGLQILKK